MKKKLSILFALVLVISLLLVPATVSADSPPAIDGIISPGEWDGALWFDKTLDNTFADPSDMPIQIYMTNDADNLYIALDIPDTYDMRDKPEVAEGGSDTFGLNIMVEGEDFDSRVLQFNTSTYPNDPSKRIEWTLLDGYMALWTEATVGNLPVPAGVQSSTTIDGTGRVQEISIPLSDLGVSPGDVIRIGGAIRAAKFEGYNFHALYPAGLVWGDGETYKDFLVQGNTIVGLAAEIDDIIAINVSPTSIDFGPVTPGTPVSGATIEVENIGQVAVDVSASINPTGGVFQYLFLNGKDHPTSGAWTPGDLGMANMVPTSSANCATWLNVPLTYSAQGSESTTLIFLATATS